jgi:hypothetical protein
MSCLARTSSSFSAPARRNPTVCLHGQRPWSRPGGDRLITGVGGRPGVPCTRLIPAASARMSSRPAAMSRGSAIDSARSKIRGHRASYLTSVVDQRYRGPPVERAAAMTDSKRPHLAQVDLQLLWYFEKRMLIVELRHSHTRRVASSTVVTVPPGTTGSRSSMGTSRRPKPTIARVGSGRDSTLANNSNAGRSRGPVGLPRHRRATCADRCRGRGSGSSRFAEWSAPGS